MLLELWVFPGGIGSIPASKLQISCRISLGAHPESANSSSLSLCYSNSFSSGLSWLSWLSGLSLQPVQRTGLAFEYRLILRMFYD